MNKCMYCEIKHTKFSENKNLIFFPDELLELTVEKAFLILVGKHLKG